MAPIRSEAFVNRNGQFADGRYHQDCGFKPVVIFHQSVTGGYSRFSVSHDVPLSLLRMSITISQASRSRRKHRTPRAPHFCG